LESGITENTKHILVEIANFDPVAVRKTGTRLSLRTDAELRYEKNISPVWSLYCLLLFLDELKYFKKDLGKFTLGGLDAYWNDEVKTMINTSKIIDVDYKHMSQCIFGKQNKTMAKITATYLE
jgi:phenylalanyl-tRNA synthetase beta subunit